MSKRFGWMLGLAVLVGVGFLVACGTTYNASSNGLLLVGSQGSAVVETFGFDLGSGHISAIGNSPNDTAGKTCLLPGIPSSMVVDPAGQYAYAILTHSAACDTATTKTVTGIAAFKVNSDGTTATVGNVTADPNPIQLVMDPSGKFLFVAEGTNAVVNVYAIGSGATLTSVPSNYNFVLPPGFQTPNFVATAPTPTVFPALNAVCATTTGTNPPTTEFLYVADQENNVVWEFGVDPSTGALGNPQGFGGVQSYQAGTQPDGVVVDACNRFVYVANYLSNNISAYTICSTVSATCPQANGQLIPVAHSPFSVGGSALNPGPMVGDPYGDTLYVVDLGSNMVSTFRIAPVSGSLTTGSPATVNTGLQPTSIGIRSDDTWLFVSNFNAASVSPYAITPSTGALTPQTAIDTDNYPWGIAVK